MEGPAIASIEEPKIAPATFRISENVLDAKATNLAGYQLYDNALLDKREVIFTGHAKKRFRERFPAFASKENLLSVLLRGATEDKTMSSKDKVIRILNNNFTSVLYLKNGNMRFIVKEERKRYIVITVEKPD
ncbi:MAG: hypothetical protein Q8O83_02685 [bacterium]|nr:hypothetical protein [bacterium]